MSLSTVYHIFVFMSLTMSFIFFITLINKIENNNDLWVLFSIYWIFTFSTAILFIIRSEYEPKFRNDVLK